MDGMKRRAAVTDIGRQRNERITRARAARRRLERADSARGSRTGGRVWVNGVEMGGTDPRHSTLALAYD